MTKEELNGEVNLPDGKRFRITALNSQGQTAGETSQPFTWNGQTYSPPVGRHWSVMHDGLRKLDKKKRLILEGKNLCYKRYLEDYPVSDVKNIWMDAGGGALVHEKQYVVQTTTKVIQRCVLLSTDPGDLILDPTCGSGTTAFVAEQFGRRWITIDTSRIALNIAKQRLMTAVFPYYKLYDSGERRVASGEKETNHIITNHSPDIRQGFIYKTVPHITLKSLANDEPPATETLYDKPEVDNKRLRVSGPFTVETLQNFEPISPEELDNEIKAGEDDGAFEEVIKQHLVSAGIKNGRKNEMVIFTRVELLTNENLHAEGFYNSGERLVASGEQKTSHSSLTTGERKAYFHIGPKFGTVSKTAVNEAIKECRQRGDASWLIILGFSFESAVEGSTQTTSMGTFEVTKVRIHDDLLQEGLKKKPAKSAASFVTIGEPDIEVASDEWLVNSKNEIICNYGILKKLSGLDSLAKINGLSDNDLRAYCLFSQRRDVWLNLSDAESGSFNFSEYSRRASEKFDWRISSVLGNSERFFIGTRDFDYFISEIELPDERKFRKSVDAFGRDKQNAQWLTQIPEVKQLTTRHYSLITIKGLDIYDPIRDEVKARSVHDIAYWMVDDDYDGSSFVVKQVFFCGGDKSEFDKWKKGLSDLSKQETKRSAERTLKIEIDDEAFGRLYGHISHPIEITKKGQKIAVRIISQFGEEAMKVLTP